MLSGGGTSIQCRFSGTLSPPRLASAHSLPVGAVMERSRHRARRVSHKLGKSINNPISDTQTASPEGLNSVSRALCVLPSTDQSDSPLQGHSPIRFSEVSLSEKGDFSTIRHAATHVSVEQKGGDRVHMHTFKKRKKRRSQLPLGV